LIHSIDMTADGTLSVLALIEIKVSRDRLGV
jgi:hypothetical protein